MTFLWILLGIVYIACWIYFGLATFRKGHYWMFWIGFFIPILWIIGALIAPTQSARRAPRRGGVAAWSRRQPGFLLAYCEYTQQASKGHRGPRCLLQPRLIHRPRETPPAPVRGSPRRALGCCSCTTPTPSSRGLCLTRWLMGFGSGAVGDPVRDRTCR